MSDELEQQRRQMVDDQVAARGIQDARVLEAMRTVPRHEFVAVEARQWAYADAPVTIGHGQTISQPYIVALMTELLHLKGDECVLDVGTGSGYQAAVLSRLVPEVHTIEVIPELARAAEAAFQRLGYSNIFVHVGDGSAGWYEGAPYGGIVVAAAAPSVPEPLLEQLAEGAHLVIPIGSAGFQQLEVWKCSGQDYKREINLPVAFVPLRGEHGWK